MSSVLIFLVVSSTIVHVTSSALRSSVVVIGSRVKLNCSLDENESVVWKYTSWNTSKETNIYFGMDIVASMKSRYKIDKNISGQHNLIIGSVDFAHAGRYECAGTMQQSMLSDIQLTVLGSPPVCSANTSNAIGGSTERGYLQMWCHIIYTGNTIPNMTWTKDNTNDTIIPSVSRASDNRAMPLTHTFLVIRQLQATDNGATFKCKTTFQLPSIPEENKDDYEYTWSYKPYGPSLSVVRYEERLECSADGNPIPTYRWTHVDGENFIEGPVLILNHTATSKKNVTFQCIATNLFGSVAVNFSTSEMFISAEKKSAGLSWSMNALGLVLLIAFLTVLGIVILGIGIRLTKLSSTFDEDKVSVKKISSLSKSPSKRLNAPPTTEEETKMHRADVSDNYCALADRSTASQQPQVYCELRSYDQPSVKPSSSKQKTEYKDLEYANLGLHETQL